MMPVPFRWTAGEVPAGSGRGEAQSAAREGWSAFTPLPPPALRAALATAAAAAAAFEWRKMAAPGCTGSRQL